MAPPALSTRDTRTSLYTYPPTLALSILSSGSRYYSLAPALPTHGSMMLDLPLYIYISVRFNPTLLRFSFLLLSSPRPYVSLSLLPYPLATTYRLFNSVSGSPYLLYRATARGLLYRENDSLESRSRKPVSSARGGASSFSLTRLSPLLSLSFPPYLACVSYLLFTRVDRKIREFSAERIQTFGDLISSEAGGDSGEIRVIPSLRGILYKVRNVVLGQMLIRG